MPENRRCRCGAWPSKRCVSCGGEAHNGWCNAHPTAKVETIRCLDCSEPLCFWHYVLQPTSELRYAPTGSQNVVVLRQACFPSCSHALRVKERRPAEL